jgi:hypothetical protein
LKLTSPGVRAGSSLVPIRTAQAQWRRHWSRRPNVGSSPHSGPTAALPRTAGRGHKQTPDPGHPRLLSPDLPSGFAALFNGNIPGHLKAEGDEQKGSQSYIPKEAKDDKALQTALALIRGTETNPAFPPNPKQAASEH